MTKKSRLEELKERIEAEERDLAAAEQEVRQIEQRIFWYRTNIGVLKAAEADLQANPVSE